MSNSRPRHSLSQVDTDSKRAICSVCGPVRIRVRTGRGNQCWTLQLAERRARKPRPNNPSTRTPEEKRAEALQRKYKMTVEQYEALLLEQAGVCALCGRECTTGRRLAVDHDHDTGRIRGLLCRACNVAIGYFREDVAVMARAIDYLSRER